MHIWISEVLGVVQMVWLGGAGHLRDSYPFSSVILAMEIHGQRIRKLTWNKNIRYHKLKVNYIIIAIKLKSKL